MIAITNYTVALHNDLFQVQPLSLEEIIFKKKVEEEQAAKVCE